MSSWARPGAKCVCVKDGGWGSSPGAKVPGYGQVLTVRTVETVSGGTGLTFAEIINEPYSSAIDGYGECLFNCVWFRPLVDQSDDVALFTHHLDTVGEPA